MCCQLGAVVHAQVLGRVTRCDQPLQHRDGPVGIYAVLRQHLERLAGELLDDVEQPDHPTVGGLIMLEVKSPHLIGPHGPQPLSRDGRVPQPPPLRRLIGTRSPSSRHSR